MPSRFAAWMNSRISPPGNPNIRVIPASRSVRASAAAQVDDEAAHGSPTEGVGAAAARIRAISSRTRRSETSVTMREMVSPICAARQPLDDARRDAIEIRFAEPVGAAVERRRRLALLFSQQQIEGVGKPGVRCVGCARCAAVLGCECGARVAAAVLGRRAVLGARASRCASTGRHCARDSAIVSTAAATAASIRASLLRASGGAGASCSCDVIRRSAGRDGCSPFAFSPSRSFIRPITTRAPRPGPARFACARSCR